MFLNNNCTHIMLRLLRVTTPTRRCHVLAVRKFSSQPLPPKDFSGEMAASYDPMEVERDWYAWWEKNRMFESDAVDPSKPQFTMVIPPPNVTGSLHIGHALTNTLQDALVRWRRMHGDQVTWVPGLDHAGIATQTVVEKHLAKTQPGTTRHTLGRERFVGEVWKWVDQYGGRINHQLRQLGLSLAWSRAAFTLDAPRSAAVTEAFVRLHRDGLVFRAARVVHWCTHLRTAISDIEVEFVEVTKRTKHKLPGGQRSVDIGVMHRLKYDVVDANGAVCGTVLVDTTRPETILADQAVAVHPEDTRYLAFQGKRVAHPLIPGVLLPIVLDSVLVDPAMGTGVVKVTPAHDPADFECSQRHNLPSVNMLNDDGTVNKNVPTQYQGMHRFQCREAVVQALTAAGRYEGARDHAMRVGLCSRSGDILEPRLKPQWFVRCDGLNAAARSAVSGLPIESILSNTAAEASTQRALTLYPEARSADWERWLSSDASRVWCVSRQLWWGHRVPAWRLADSEDWVVARSEADARAEIARQRSMSTEQAAALVLQQDEDVLDTWFSSALFPMTTFGWPAQGAPAGYPLSIMVTGRDIMFFWVARMVMLCSHLTSASTKVPFPRAVLHPLVRGSDGRKMSKSLGNVIDPCDLMEGRALSDLLARLKTSNLDAKQMTSAESLMKKDYPQGMKPCGADALRLALVSRVNLDEYITLDYKKVLACRQLANKIWQCARFVRPHTDQNAINEFVGGSAQSNASSNQIWEAAISPASVTKSYSQLDSSQRWILFHLYECVAACNAHMHALQWRAAAEHLQTFFVSRLCDVYLEFSKTTLASSDLQQRNNARAVLLLCFETFLRLLHPIMPYLTEELWHRLPAAVRSSTASSISLASYPLTHQYACFAAPSVKHASTVPQCFDTKAVEQQASSIQTDKAVQASVSEFDLILSVLDAFRAQKASIAAKSVIANITVTVASSESQRTVLEFEQHLAFLTRAKCMMVNVDTALTGAPTVKIGTEASVPL